jgi:toxin ParE1/3/4
MALRLAFRPAAEADLDVIYDYIARESPDRALDVIRRIRTRCGQLTEFPELGRRRDDLRPGARLLPFERRGVIVYGVAGDTIEVGRIFYGGRDYDTLMTEES